MRKNHGKRTGINQYQIAATLLVVASIGFAGMYLQQRMSDSQQDTGKVQEETKSVSTQLEPRVEEAKETLPVQESPSEPVMPSTENITQEAPVEETAQLHFDEKLQWPLEGEILINYSMDHTVYFPTLNQYKYNPALIIQGNVNDKVTAAAPGTITTIENNAKTGCTITVDLGDGYTAIYGQLKEVPVYEGKTVSTGEVLGYVSEPSKYYTQEGSNLYFQMLSNGTSINPMEFLAQ